MSQPDLRALRALRDGDVDAFRALVAEYHPMLLRLASVYLTDPARAERAVADTWAAALRELDDFDGRISFRAWLCRFLLAARGEPAGAGPPPAGPAVPAGMFYADGLFARRWNTEWADWSRLPAPRLFSAEVRDVVTEAVAALPGPAREVLTLRDIEGWSTVEVTDLLSISDLTQRALLHRGRSQVRLALQEHLLQATLN